MQKYNKKSYLEILLYNLKEIILICWFAQETFIIIIINVE